MFVVSCVDLGFDCFFGGGDLVVGKCDFWFEWVMSEVVVGVFGFFDDGVGYWVYLECLLCCVIVGYGDLFVWIIG